MLMSDWSRSGTGATTADANRIRSKNFIPVLPDTVYYCLQSLNHSVYAFAYDKNQVFIGTIGSSNTTNKTFTTPSKCWYIKFFSYASGWTDYVNHGNICINLSHNGSRNGEYQPYEKHSYPLDSSLTLRGIPKLSADNQLYFDGDEYLPEGKVNRRFGIVDLGTLNWTLENNQQFYSDVVAPGMSGWHYDVICSKYAQKSDSYTTDATPHIRGIANGRLYIVDTNYSDAQSFTNSLSGVMLVYPITQTEETAEPYSEIQLVNDWGTEEYVSGTICPVGHETRYPANLRDKLQHLPDLASADGYYVVQQTGGQMSLVHFRIPQAPADDGTYTLKATVSGGVPTYTWEVVT